MKFSKKAMLYMAWAPILGFVGIIPFIIYIFYQMTQLPRNGSTPDTFMIVIMIIFYAFVLLMSLFQIFSLVIFILHAMKNPTMKDNDNIVWLLVIVLAGQIGNIVYYYAKVHNSPDFDFYPFGGGRKKQVPTTQEQPQNKAVSDLYPPDHQYNR